VAAVITTPRPHGPEGSSAQTPRESFSKVGAGRLLTVVPGDRKGIQSPGPCPGSSPE